MSRKKKNKYFYSGEIIKLQRYARENEITSIATLIYTKVFKEQDVDSETEKLILWPLIEKLSDTLEVFNFSDVSQMELEKIFELGFEKLTEWTISLKQDIEKAKRQQ